MVSIDGFAMYAESFVSTIVVRRPIKRRLEDKIAQLHGAFKRQKQKINSSNYHPVFYNVYKNNDYFMNKVKDHLFELPTLKNVTVCSSFFFI